MTVIGSTSFHVALAVIFVILTAYSAGRVHQWYRHTFERDVAYREGYNQASQALFKLAVRKNPSRAEQAVVAEPTDAPPTPIRAIASVHSLDAGRKAADRV